MIAPRRPDGNAGNASDRFDSPPENGELDDLIFGDELDPELVDMICELDRFFADPSRA